MRMKMTEYFIHHIVKNINPDRTIKAHNFDGAAEIYSHMYKWNSFDNDYLEIIIVCSKTDCYKIYSFSKEFEKEVCDIYELSENESFNIKNPRRKNV